jgi:hypothetical protein
MPATNRLVGYDRQTDRMKLRFEVPEHPMPEAKRIANVPADDPEAAWSYPLSAAATICSIVNCPIALGLEDQSSRSGISLPDGEI